MRPLQKEKVIEYDHLRTLLGGIIVQDQDNRSDNMTNSRIMTDRIPSPKETEDLIFASKVCKHSKSNAISLVKNKQLLASGVGQTSRVDSTKQAISKGIRNGFDLTGAVMASDAFFPFSDCVEIANKVGIAAIIQPGGSKNDHLSIDFCNQNNISMIFSGVRHFKH